MASPALRVLFVAIVGCALPSAARGQMPPIAAIDYYGLRSVPADSIAAALGLAPGDSVPRDPRPAVTRLEEVAGVQSARLEVVCCERGGSLVYVGVVEAGAPIPRFRPAPTGSPRLAPEIVAAGSRFDSAHQAAVMAGRGDEDIEAGHSLMSDSLARSIQREFIAFAGRDEAALRAVLRSSASARDRALAAQVVAYAPDKRAVVPALVEALSDPDATVRNNAVRALALIAGLGARRPELAIRVPWEPFVALLRSPHWSDRNKVSLALLSLTETRHPALLAYLRSNAMPELREKAQWKSRGHAFPALVVIGRIEGRTEEEIFKGLAESPPR